MNNLQLNNNTLLTKSAKMLIYNDPKVVNKVFMKYLNRKPAIMIYTANTYGAAYGKSFLYKITSIQF